MSSITRKLLWLAVVALGTISFAVVALHRGETLNAAWLVVASVCIYFIAYRFYARFIAGGPGVRLRPLRLSRTPPDIGAPRAVGEYNYHPPFPEPSHTFMPVPPMIGGRRIAVAIDEADHAHDAESWSGAVAARTAACGCST